MPSTNRRISEGIVVGLIGYAAVAVFYIAFDLLAARGGFYTVNLLGRAVFRGLRDPSVLMYPVSLDAAAILLYNGLHLLIALIIGLIVTGLLGYSEQHQSRRYGVLFVIIAGFIVTIVGVGMLTTGIRPVLPMWSIVLANAFAVLLAGAYLVRRRPMILNHLRPVAV